METITALETDRYCAGQLMTKADFLSGESDDNCVYDYNGSLLKPTSV